MTLQIKMPAELVDPELEARWTTRRAARETKILQAILRRFIERPDPIVVEDFIRAFPDRAPDETRAALTSLDKDDLTVSSLGRDALLGFAANQWLELTDDPASMLVIGPAEFDRKAEVQIPLPRRQQVVLDSEALYHGGYHPGSRRGTRSSSASRAAPRSSAGSRASSRNRQ